MQQRPRPRVLSNWGTVRLDYRMFWSCESKRYRIVSFATTRIPYNSYSTWCIDLIRPSKPCGEINLDQHWLGWWFAAWLHHTITLNNMDLSSTSVRLQNLPWSKTGLVSRQVLHPLSKLQNWIWSKTGRYKTGLVSNTKIEASLRATKPKPWQLNLTSDTVEIFIQNEKAGLVPMQSRFRSRHKADFGAAGLGTAQSWFWSRHKASFGAVSRPV